MLDFEDSLHGEGGDPSVPYLNQPTNQSMDAPKWMVYKGKPYYNWWFGGTTILGNTHMELGSPHFLFGGQYIAHLGFIKQ